MGIERTISCNMVINGITGDKKKHFTMIGSTAAITLLVASIIGVGVAQSSYAQQQQQQLRIARGFITSFMIADNTIVSADLKDGAAVRSEDLVDGQVNTADLADDAVISDKIRDGEVTSEDVADGTITSADLAPDAIPPPASEGTPDDNSVTSAKIVDGEVTESDLQDNAVTSDKIRDGEVKAEDLDPSIGIGGGTSNLNFQVTERTNRIETNQPGIHPITVQCNSDEVVTGGGFGMYDNVIDIIESKKEDNGWKATFILERGRTIMTVYAECLKIVNESGTTG